MLQDYWQWGEALLACVPPSNREGRIYCNYHRCKWVGVNNDHYYLHVFTEHWRMFIKFRQFSTPSDTKIIGEALSEVKKNPTSADSTKWMRLLSAYKSMDLMKEIVDSLEGDYFTCPDRSKPDQNISESDQSLSKSEKATQSDKNPTRPRKNFMLEAGFFCTLTGRVLWTRQFDRAIGFQLKYCLPRDITPELFKSMSENDAFKTALREGSEGYDNPNDPDLPDFPKELNAQFLPVEQHKSLKILESDWNRDNDFKVAAYYPIEFSSFGQMVKGKQKIVPKRKANLFSAPKGHARITETARLNTLIRKAAQTNDWTYTSFTLNNASEKSIFDGDSWLRVEKLDIPYDVSNFVCFYFYLISYVCIFSIQVYAYTIESIAHHFKEKELTTVVCARFWMNDDESMESLKKVFSDQNLKLWKNSNMTLYLGCYFAIGFSSILGHFVTVVSKVRIFIYFHNAYKFCILESTVPQEWTHRNNCLQLVLQGNGKYRTIGDLQTHLYGNGLPVCF